MVAWYTQNKSMNKVISSNVWLSSEVISFQHHIPSNAKKILNICAQFKKYEYPRTVVQYAFIISTVTCSGMQIYIDYSGLTFDLSGDDSSAVISLMWLVYSLRAQSHNVFPYI